MYESEGYQHYDYDSFPEWDETGELESVPGFGFLPIGVNRELNLMTQDFSNITENITDTIYDYFKCTLLNDTWKYYFPQFAPMNPNDFCPPYWDEASCFPPTLANTEAIIPCMSSYGSERYNTSYNASKLCHGNGIWDKTNYSQCVKLCEIYDDFSGNISLEDCDRLAHSLGSDTANISAIIYYIGYSISLIALLGAVAIFLSFREMRCLRHKIHIGLFLTLILTYLSWIFVALIQPFILRIEEFTDESQQVIQVWCYSHVFLRYFHLTTFFWMFLEGLYLFLQVQVPLSLATIRHVHFAVFGWGCPAIATGVWFYLKLSVAHPSSLASDDGFDGINIQRLLSYCPIYKEDNIDLYSYDLLVLCLLIVNSFFLFWIMGLRSQTAMDHDRRHLKAAKALVIVIPLFGFTYILTFIGPDEREFPLGYTIFQSFRAIFLSTTGFVITLPYCYCNSEVRRALTTRWRRWIMVRNVGYESCRPRASVATNSIFISQTEPALKMKSFASSKVDEKFLNVPVVSPSVSNAGSRASSTNVSFYDLNSQNIT